MGDKIIPHSRPTLAQAEMESVEAVIQSEYLGWGSKVRQFEYEMCSYVSRKYAVAVNTGMSALHLSLIALGVDERFDVIVPSYTCISLLHAIMLVGARPVVVDVDYSTMNISLECFKDAITKKSKAIIVPHMFGYPVLEIDKFSEFGVAVIEDCAASIGGRYRGLKLGSFGKVSIFSFYATKMLTTGTGGMVSSDDKETIHRIRQLITRMYYSYQMTDMAAAMGIIQLTKLDDFVAARRIRFNRYVELLKNESRILLPVYDDVAQPAYYRFAIRIKGDINKFKDRMKKKGIECGNGVYQPLHRLLDLNSRNFPSTEALMREVVSLPIYPTLKLSEVEYVANSVLEEL